MKNKITKRNKERKLSKKLGADSSLYKFRKMKAHLKQLPRKVTLQDADGTKKRVWDSTVMNHAKAFIQTFYERRIK